MSWRTDWSVPPGDILRDVLRDREMPQIRLARAMKRPTKTINEIVNGKARITPETALQLEAALGIEAIFWLNLESHYRLHLARGQLAP